MLRFLLYYLSYLGIASNELWKTFERKSGQFSWRRSTRFTFCIRVVVPQRTDWAEKENVLRGGSKEVGARRRTAEEETAERKTDTHHKPLKPLLKKSGPVVASKLQICLYT